MPSALTRREAAAPEDVVPSEVPFCAKKTVVDVSEPSEVLTPLMAMPVMEPPSAPKEKDPVLSLEKRDPETERAFESGEEPSARLSSSRVSAAVAKSVEAVVTSSTTLRVRAMPLPELMRSPSLS